MAWYCQHCGKKIPEKSAFCRFCGSKQEPIDETDGSDSSAYYSSAARFVGKTCPFCQAPIKPGVSVEVCPMCKIPHHAECWRQNGGKCTTYGCSGEVDNHQAATVHTGTTGQSPTRFGRAVFPENQESQNGQELVNVLSEVTGFVDRIINSVGERVRINTTILVIRNENNVKETVVCRSPADGYLQHLIVKAGDKVIKGQIVARIRKIKQKSKQ